MLKHVRIEEGSIKDYEALKDLHYRKGRIIPKFIFKAMVNDELAGVIVYGPAHLSLKARNIVLPHYKQIKDRRKRARAINDDILRIWRVIVKPKFRGSGLAVKLVKDTLSIVNYPYIETLAVMANYSNFFEKAGMMKIDPRLYNNLDKPYLKALDRLRAIGFDTSLLISKRYCKDMLRSLPKDRFEEVKEIAIKYFYAEKFKHPRTLKELKEGDIDAIADALANVRIPYVYLIWKNPRFKDKPDPKIF